LLGSVRVDFESLDYPAPFLEVFFEDPTIPAVLAQRYHYEKTQVYLNREIGIPTSVWEKCGITKTDGDGDVFTIQADAADGGAITAIAAGPRMDDFATAGEAYASSDIGANDPVVEQNMLLINLIYKVLLYASSEGNAPLVNKVKPTKATGGKVGFKGRPATKRLIVEYLPRHRKERQKLAAEAESKHKFNGRRGHFRTYRAERYKEMRNKRVFIYPVPGPDGTVPNTRKQFRVVKR